MLLRIDPNSPEPLFTQVAAAVRSDVAAGRLRAGDRLPGAREVAAAAGMNIHTVLRAYQLLRDEGLIDMRRGRGAVVTDAAAAIAALQDDIAALRGRARALGLSLETLASLLREGDERDTHDQ